VCGTGDRPVIWTGSLNTRSSWKPRPPARTARSTWINHAGDVFVADAGNVFKLRHMTSMGDDDGNAMVRSTIAVSGGDSLFRTASKLFCIGDAR